MYRIFLFLLFCLPFELPIAEAAHGLFEDHVGSLYLVATVGVPLCFVAWLIAISHRSDRSIEKYWNFSSIFLSVGLIAAVLTPLTGIEDDPSGQTQLAFQQLIFGYLAPVGMGAVILRLPPGEQLRAWRWFYGGFVAYLALSAIPWLITYKSASTKLADFSQLSVSEQMLQSRYIFDEWNFYFKYIGNTNKASNYLIITLLCSTRLLNPNVNATDRIGQNTRRIYLAYWLLASITLVILLSRLALLLYPLVFLASGVSKFINARLKWLLFAAIAVGFVLAEGSVMLNYLMNSSIGDAAGQGFLGTGHNRFEQWNDLIQHLNQHPERWVMGMGVGGYGIQFFDEPLSGTHNLFLDTWMESGLLGLSLFVFLLVLMALHSATAQTFFGGDRLPAIATGVMFLLMIREHSPAYLGVTSMGGVCFALIFCVLARPLRSTRISQSGISTPVRRPMGRLRQNPSRVKLINT